MNPRAGFEPTYRISSADPSTPWVHLQFYVISSFSLQSTDSVNGIWEEQQDRTNDFVYLNSIWNPLSSWDFNHLAFCIENLISNPDPSTTWVHLHLLKIGRPIYNLLIHFSGKLLAFC